MDASRTDADWWLDLHHLDIQDDETEIGPPSSGTTGHVPAMDILERPGALELRIDLAGVPAAAVKVRLRGNRLLITGDKRPACACAPGHAAFHVAERTFGRFVRTVPLRLPFDASAIRAIFAHGELRIVVPRLEDRRGREIEIPIESL